ncbi:DUF4350 domain-containing protein [Cellulomonas oligotrophica]|uniref:DUF4350 domain-containing protein n=1 Tax=Cellulomonas oligotrophica TaxID=931536 RepID=A0A7Y9FDY8_9CELL|nr:DUF4350 domain-containing protein [Cellulomonas oligotrophica]NYD85197.1 hypothetical protein [Cellulomonas oligotrophica]GIG34172.1 hypothetical protein Col01nite_33310 [Cellulomonas oligotrophica]
MSAPVGTTGPGPAPAAAPPSRTGPSTTPAGPDPTVVGDGTTARSRARSRWRRARGWVLVLAFALPAIGILALPAPPASTTPGAPDNPGAAGSRALAQVLQRQGVEVTYVRTSAAALAAAEDGGTVLVVGDTWLMPEQAEALVALDNDLVLVNAAWTLSYVSPTAGTSGSGAATSTREAGCDDPDAVAAGTITAGGGLRAGDGDGTVCFPTPDDPGAGAYLALEQDGRRVSALSDLTPLTNAALAEEGNAALALRLLGRHDTLVWYLPGLDDAGGVVAEDTTSLTDLVPWVRAVVLWLLLVLAVTVVQRARRFGPVVAETLPVVVRSAEATRGRGRLYRRARAHGHAGAALRAGTAARLAQRLGLPRSASGPALVDAVHRASGRPARDVDALLYGPPPTDDAALQRLAADLDQLESEVHRP